MDEKDQFQEQGEGEQQYYPGAPPYQGPPPPPRSGLSKRGWTVVAVVLGILIICVVIGAGIAIDRLLFSHDKGSGEFKLENSTSYQEALFDIKRYFYRDYSEQKITDAAKLAVEKAKKKGVKSRDKLEDIGLTALAGALHDERSGYLTAEENKSFSEDLKGSFYGVGITLRLEKEQDRPEVFSIIKGSPSERAGIKKDDLILSVDGKDTKGKKIDEVIHMIRGKEGTRVTLKVKRPSTNKVIDFKMTREKIKIPDLETEILDGRYGWLRLFNFSSGVGAKLRSAIADMKKKGVQGFILDVRDDPGGLLVEAVNVARLFMKDGVIVSYQTKGQKKADEAATGTAETDLPLVVLTNGGSASSSEIVAGAVKDRKRGVLVGSKTYGKGSVQRIFQLANKGGMKLTVSLYYLANGESIDGKGIDPDVVVEDKEDPKREDRLQLDKAKEVLQELIQGRPVTEEILRPAA